MVATLLLILPPLAHAQESNNQEALDLTQAISLALSEHPEMAVFIHQRDALNARVNQAKILPRPTIGLTIEDAMGTGTHSNFGAAQSTLNIAWVLEQRAIDSRVNAAKNAATQVDFERGRN